MPKGTKRDPNLDHEAVKAYRDQFRFCPNAGTRKDIVVTVTDLELWKDVLENWGYTNKKGKWIKFNPLNVRRMLSEYERREAKHSQRPNGAGQRFSQRESHEKDLQVGVSRRWDRNMSGLREDERVQFRRGSKSLEEIVTKALRKGD